MQAKQEDLAAEQAEVFRLEGQLPKAQANPKEEDTFDEEAKAVVAVRRLAATKGGHWNDMLAAMQAASSGSGNRPPQRQVQATEDETVEHEGTAANKSKQDEETENTEPMEVDRGQNAVVDAVKAVVADPAAGATLAAVPTMGKRSAQTAKAAAAAAALKTRRTG